RHAIGAGYAPRAAVLIEEDEAGLESVSNRQQARITRSKLAVFYGVRRSLGGTGKDHIEKRSRSLLANLGTGRYEDHRLVVGVGQLIDVELLAVLVDAEWERNVLAAERGRNHPRIARVGLDLNSS